MQHPVFSNRRFNVGFNNDKVIGLSYRKSSGVTITMRLTVNEANDLISALQIAAEKVAKL